jgi:lipoate-protein ligase B
LPEIAARKQMERTLMDQGAARCVVRRLGLTEYLRAWQFQKELHRERLEGLIPNTLLLLEHPPTFTMGKSGSVENVLVPIDELERRGISLFFIERGGDVTYHGPGQIVGYPIFDLRDRGKDIRRFVFELEETIIRTLKDFSIESGRDETHPGVWRERAEIAAIGLSVRRWVSMHGFALNVNTGQGDFSLINPCGFSDRRATSMAEVLGTSVDMEAVAERLLANFSDVFGVTLEEHKDSEGAYDERTATVVV